MSTPTTDAEAEFKAWSLLNPPEDAYAKMKRTNAEYVERKQKEAYALSKGIEPTPAPGAARATNSKLEVVLDKIAGIEKKLDDILARLSPISTLNFRG